MSSMGSLGYYICGACYLDMCEWCDGTCQVFYPDVVAYTECECSAEFHTQRDLENKEEEEDG